jgi:hypothetical protein
MSESHSTPSSDSSPAAESGSSSEKGGKERAAHKGTFATRQEAHAVTPPSDKFRLFTVTDPTGTEVHTWAQSVDMAITNAARADGYTARVAEPKSGGPITKERVASRLAEFTDEELAAMGLSRKKGRK